MLEKGNESIEDGEKDKRINYRGHQTGMGTGVKCDKGFLVSLWKI